VDKDAAVLAEVCRGLERAGMNVLAVSETETLPPARGYISMGRMPRTLDFLRERGLEGKLVVNSADGVALCCNRRLLNMRLSAAGIPMPPCEGTGGYWLKRAAGTAESSGDVQYAATREDMLRKRDMMMARGIGEPVVQAHVEGDLVKFYGVAGIGFFRTYYPSEDGQWKFGDERRNGMARHYPFSVARLHEMADRAASAAGVTVYGGDCIVDAAGRVVIIDFNDWPSFSRCRKEAAAAIASHIINKYRKLCLAV